MKSWILSVINTTKTFTELTINFLVEPYALMSSWVCSVVPAGPLASYLWHKHHSLVVASVTQRAQCYGTNA